MGGNTGVVPSVLLIIGLSIIPESPRWIAKIGKETDFEASSQTLRGPDTDISVEEAEIKTTVEAKQQQSRIRISDLIERRYALPLTVSFGLPHGSIKTKHIICFFLGLTTKVN